MVKKLVVIFGTNGVGKSSLARKILGDGYKEAVLKNGKVSLSSDKKILALGPYANKCGGADVIKNTKKLSGLYSLLSEAISNYPDVEIFLFEGVIISTVFGSNIRNLLELKYEKGFQIEIVLLTATIETSLVRVFGRNGNIAKTTNVLSKAKSSMRVFKKFAETSEFNCIAIRTDNLNQEEVFEQFKKNSSVWR